MLFDSQRKGTCSIQLPAKVGNQLIVVYLSSKFQQLPLKKAAKLLVFTILAMYMPCERPHKCYQLSHAQLLIFMIGQVQVEQKSMIGSALAKKVRMRTRRSIGSSFADRRPSCTQSRQPKYIQHFTVPALLLLRKSEYLSLWCSSEVSNEEMHQCAKLYCVVKMRFKKIGL